jgi:PPK2 family polyphosphate:nucleotide phosphotransferase
MKKTAKACRVGAGDKVDLAKWPTRVDPVYDDKGDYKRRLEDHVERLARQQELLYASNAHAILVIFQAMDAAGKDGCIKHVMSGVNPQGCEVHSYAHPTPIELKHDFLWRTTRDLPARGKIGIYNRSYYEEVLIVRVHPEILAAQNLPDDGHDARLWQERFRSITGLERHLSKNGTRIVKFFLHVSKEEQKKRLLARMDTPEKHWKVQAGDVAERRLWKEYRKAYEEVLAETSTKEAPWYVIPADDKPTARLLVSHILLETLQGLDMTYPAVSEERAKEIAELRRQLEKD